MKIKGRVINGGNASGEALVLDVPFSFIGDFDPDTGKITILNHPLFGKKRPEHSKLMKRIMKNNDKRFIPKANKILTHHIDLNRFNSKKSNLLKITFRKHTALHQRAYDYLVKIGLIKKYIKWFLKTYKGNKKR